MKISVVIPTVNEAENLAELLPTLRHDNVKEVIVVDGGSRDKTIEIAKQSGTKIIHTKRSRPIQMNAGAKVATAEVIYFVHADSRPPAGFARDILATVNRKYPFGCFRSLFNTNSKFLKFNSYFTRFKGLMFRGGGQTLWVTKALFEKLNGFDESLILMEEYDFIHRAKKVADYRIIPKNVLVSARTYNRFGNVKTQFIYAIVMMGFFLGFNQYELKQFIRKWLR